MATYTLQELILEARRRGGYTTSPYVTDSEQTTTDDEWTDYINEGAADLHERQAETGEYYKVSYASKTITTGNTFARPDDLFKLLKVERYTSDSLDGYATIYEYQNAEIDNRVQAFYPQLQQRYTLLGDTFHIQPHNLAAGDYRITYVPEYANLVNASDSLSIPQNWQSYITVYAALQVKIKEGIGDTGDLERQLARLQERLSRVLPSRGQLRQVKNVFSARRKRILL